MNRPWMPLYVADYLADTAHLSAAESGAYLHLIMHYWLKGSLPQDHKQLAKIARMSLKLFNRSVPILAPFFGPNWTHKRIEQELLKVREITEKRRSAVSQRKDRVHTNEPTFVEQMNTHSHSHIQPQEEIERKEKSKKKESRSPSLAEFEQFWKAYPRKVGKGAAQKAWAAAVRKADPDRIIEAVERYAWPDEPSFIPHASTWLNGQRWEDELPNMGPRKPSEEELERMERERLAFLYDLHERTKGNGLQYDDEEA